MVNCCGLVTDRKEPVPLKSIDAQLEVKDHVATLVSTLNYENKEDKPLEAVFVFPLPGDAAVCHFSAQIGETHIVAEVKEKQQAQEEYDDALSSGQQAFLLEESDESPDIFSLKVGSLPPGESVKLGAGHKFDRDVELLIYYKDAHQPSAVVEAGQASAKPGSLMGDPVVMVSLYPEFPQSVMSSLAACGEFVFLVDRSGSMGCPMNNSTPQETRISSAKDTLLLLLKSLPMGCYFNIYSFGSSFEHIFPTSVEYSEKTMKEALEKVEKMGSNLGGTEILRPLKHIYSQACIPKHPRQMFVFTDGEVGNTKEKAIFQGQRSLIYAQLTVRSSEEAGGSVTVKYSLAGHPSQNQLHFKLKPAEDSGLTVHRLAARTVIRSLESEERTRRGQQDEEVKIKVVELSIQSRVSSCFTAFIAVNKDSGKAVQGPLVRRNVPTAFLPQMMGCSLPQRPVLMACSAPRRLARSIVCVGSAPPVDFQSMDCSPPRRIHSKEMSCRSNAAEAIDYSERSYPKSVQPHKDPLLQLVSLQKASGSWMLDEDLTAVLGKTKEEVEKAKPELVGCSLK
ncbi:von Willebrand factor A domain-containing protein 5A-like [Poecilia formosa]|uniref:von Willebrand factor A domain-containing protein 5A-like n=1 Tax=Poecilia formosa TaxID=48698 RepID=UPI0007BA7362|nr:PREDICTED: von Willebrand factor A domain-containing protein 5A-like [Poecilia formosa]